ncbi:hypothetical protein [Candidatus Poriferisodalis sp.]|uniref:hypothetical protein n=1 Tax=Candidatus Poriferisodalis sp. TaxID=3101277 RepID=UPI003C6EE840
MLVVLPLAGLALQSADRLSIYLNAGATGANPLEAARRAWRLTGNYLDEGSFGPIGRFVEFLVHGLAIEAGDALSLAPHAALGAVRLAMVGLLAVLAFKLIESLQRSAHTHAGRSFIGLYPLALAAALVANGLGGGLAQVPHTSIGAVAVVLAVALATSRDRDMAVRPVAWHEYASMAAMGAAAAAFDELAYLAPFVAAALLAARSVASGLPPRRALRIAAVRRWAALTAGFAVVFIPARFAIAQSCAADYACNDGWILNLGPVAIGAAVARLGSALPLAGWIANSDRADAAGLDLGFGAVLANSMLIVALLVLLALALTAVLRGRHRAAPNDVPNHVTDDVTEDPGPHEQHTPRQLRLALALGGLGAAIAGASSLYAGLSWWVQQLPFGLAVRQGWRDTLLAQVGWSLIAAAVLACLDLFLRRRAAHVLKPVAALALAVAAGFTLVANWQLAQIDRYDETASVTTLISASTVNMGLADSAAGIAELNDWPLRTDGVDYPASPSAVRCLLLEVYADREASAPESHIAAEQLRADLNRLTTERNGVPYCDQAAEPTAAPAAAPADDSPSTAPEASAS